LRENSDGIARVVRANIQIHALTKKKTPAERLIGALALAAQIHAADA
jgi:hypothetical protein